MKFVNPDEQHKGLLSILFFGVGAVLVAGSLFGAGLWATLLVLRSSGVIDTIVSYRNCVLLGYIYVFIRSYDKQMFRNK